MILLAAKIYKYDSVRESFHKSWNNEIQKDDSSFSQLRHTHRKKNWRNGTNVVLKKLKEVLPLTLMCGVNTHTDTYQNGHTWTLKVYPHTLPHRHWHTQRSAPPATTNQWTSSYNPPPAGATALTAQTNWPCRAAAAGKRHKTKERSCSGSSKTVGRCWWWYFWLIPACQPVLNCCPRLWRRTFQHECRDIWWNKWTFLGSFFYFSSLDQYINQCSSIFI